MIKYTFLYYIMISNKKIIFLTMKWGRFDRVVNAQSLEKV